MFEAQINALIQGQRRGGRISIRLFPYLRHRAIHIPLFSLYVVFGTLLLSLLIVHEGFGDVCGGIQMQLHGTVFKECYFG